MPKGFTPQEKELIGKRLLEQGYRLFSAHGLKKTNVEEIAQAAELSVDVVRTRLARARAMLRRKLEPFL